MDPDAALDELVALLDRVHILAETHLPPTITAEDTRRILELIDGLDGWLTSGGFLPTRWKPVARRTE